MVDFPRMATVNQTFEAPKLNSIEQRLQQQFQIHSAVWDHLAGKRIAVTTGSRGISHIDRILKQIVNTLKVQGAQPFIVPAMGSHGGATDEGQADVLKHYDINSETMGVAINPSMESVQVGETEDGIPVFIGRAAYEADGVVLVNRIKPHTDFHGEVESGLMKMTAIGLGKVEGANAFHSRMGKFSADKMIQTMAEIVYQSGNILGGFAILENAYHETADIEFIPVNSIAKREKELLKQAKALMPSLPVDQADILIIDEIGKNISGTGLDPNITGRWYRLNSVWQEKPDITRIVIRDVTAESKGNAVGLGLADFCHKRVVDKMDHKSTYLNAIISRNTPNAAIPMYFENDHELMEHVFLSLGEGINRNKVKLIRIKNTLELAGIAVSEALAANLHNHPNVKSISELRTQSFDQSGNFSD